MDLLEILTAYRELTTSAFANFCDANRASHRRLSEAACDEITILQTVAEQAVDVYARNRSILTTLAERTAAIEARLQELERDTPAAVDLTSLQQEVEQLDQRVKALRAAPPSHGPDAARHHEELMAATGALQDRQNELFEKKHHAFTAGTNNSIDRIRFLTRLQGHQFLLAAAWSIGSDLQLPDGLSVVQYRMDQIKERGRTTVDDLKSQGDSSVNAILAVLDIAADVQNAVINGTAQLLLFLRSRRVKTQDDVGALLRQREHLQRLLEFLNLQNRHLEPLLAASDVSH
jgi:hypothetical protein